MAAPVLLPPAFGGMYQDRSRDRLPKGKAWNMVDIIPDQLGAPGAERGGFGYASPDLSLTDGAATYAQAICFAEFSAGAQLLTIDDNGHLLKITNPTTVADMGSGVNKPLQSPMLLHDVLVIPSPDGTSAAQQYSGTAVSTLAGAPTSRYGCVYVNRVWLANSLAQRQRVYASDAGDPTTWDLTNTWIDVSAPVTGIAALPNVMLVFTSSHAIRFRGSNPPPQSDMTVDDPIFQYGCTDARSIKVNGSYVAFANPQGVFLSNGTAFPTDLTAATGIKKYWRDMLASYSSSSWTLAGDWYGNLYVITVMNGSTFVDGFIFDVKQSQVYRISNVDGAMFASANVGAPELYVASRKHPRVYALSTIFTPSATYKNDADGTPVLGSWETPFYETARFGSQRWRDLYIEYDLRDSAADAPTMTLGYITSPEQTSYTTLAPTLAATSAKTPARMHIRRSSRGMGFKLTRANASAQAKVYSLAATVTDREGSRLR